MEELIWRRSTRTGPIGGNCVEVATNPHRVLVRDSKDTEGPVLDVGRDDWRAFLNQWGRA
jgi:hypothetical protein